VALTPYTMLSVALEGTGTIFP